MAKSPAVERAVRIELLRAKAALEREILVERIVDAGESLRPRALLSSVWPAVASSKGPGIAMSALTLLRKYPVVGSSLSAMALRGGKKLGWLKAAGGLWLGWRILTAMRDAKQDRLRSENDERDSA